MVIVASAYTQLEVIPKWERSKPAVVAEGIEGIKHGSYSIAANKERSESLMITVYHSVQKSRHLPAFVYESGSTVVVL